ncbi:hypothetical protein Mhypo_03170 [Meiothermus hypogaeus]|uniref:Uncharacterized protein n=1 Tax=Meiothermus hypogaeus TaxID=884155 RepID=A0ABX9MLW7_9DEIN|nr:hypothetical protein Mhypo_03170 [Meiothermus hypogaeus]
MLLNSNMLTLPSRPYTLFDSKNNYIQIFLGGQHSTMPQKPSNPSY